MTIDPETSPTPPENPAQRRRLFVRLLKGLLRIVVLLIFIVAVFGIHAKCVRHRSLR